HHQAFLRVRAGEQGVLLQPVPGRELPLLTGHKRQHRRQRPDAELLPLRDPQVGALSHLEVVTHRHPARGPALDPVHGHPQVVDLGDVTLVRHQSPPISTTSLPVLRRAARSARADAALWNGTTRLTGGRTRPCRYSSNSSWYVAATCAGRRQG